MSAIKLTVREVLEDACFEQAELVAGDKGLDNIVRWVHIMEVTNIDNLLNGSELILSTGVGWRDFKGACVSYFQQLIDAGVAALCIELVKYANSIPQEMLELANEHRIPLIVFHQEVRFIDISQVMNKRLVNTQYRILSDLEDFSSKLNQVMLLPNACHRVLKLIHQYLRVQVIYIPHNSEDITFLPLPNKNEQQKLVATIEADKENRVINRNKQFIATDQSYVGQSVQAMDVKFADIIFFTRYQAITEYELLVLDRCANAISQDLIRAFYLEEQRKQKKQQWIYEWISGSYKEEDIIQYLSSLDATINPNGAVVCVCRLHALMHDDNQSYHIAVFRNVLQKYGFFLVSLYDQKQFVFVLVNVRTQCDWKLRLEKVIRHIANMNLYKLDTTPYAWLGVGKLTEDIHEIQESYQSALEALAIQNQAKIKDKIFYEDLHIYRLVASLNKAICLEDYIQEYLGEVLDYDEAHNSDLLYTLQKYLECNGSKNDAAKRLYVVRQTLYHRLSKLKELLGADFMEPAKRSTIEFLIHAYRYQYPNHEQQVLKSVVKEGNA
ncbi:PucR family transcriptional regulator [Gracilibacillus salinarum]|uniref:PucR family transcriptional regulator ligand-binding domain-containing protein n=1 Tax=Gracilibacillus salinarum TaxID=2932255 RepID=A0ABY4GJD0_9BACI|nr:PucR family transcriptional regulator [Gracilibacillus salinarum]UOQ84460.1 PucR family transcriptional regulator ligand-binding domain-containing protein [Gracilibacillus salinarum]